MEEDAEGAIPHNKTRLQSQNLTNLASSQNLISSASLRLLHMKKAEDVVGEGEEEVVEVPAQVNEAAERNKAFTILKRKLWHRNWSATK